MPSVWLPTADDSSLNGYLLLLGTSSIESLLFNLFHWISIHSMEKKKKCSFSYHSVRFDRTVGSKLHNRREGIASAKSL